MAGQLVPEFPPAVVIAGMHRSGMSLAASLVAAGGVSLGPDPVPAARPDSLGPFEDPEFQTLHRQVLAANGLAGEGFTCRETIEIPVSARQRAAELVRCRRHAGQPWGWKDPRTTLFLDFWATLVPEARWLFVVRPPEEVVDSLFRCGDPAIGFDPRHAVDVWVAYHSRILDFVRREPRRSLVVDLSRVVTDPVGLVADVATLLDTALGTPGPRYEPGRLRRGPPARRAGLVQAVRPEACELYRELLRLGGGDDPALPGGVLPPAAIAAAGLAEWAAGCRAVADQAAAAAREASARQAAERAERALLGEQSVRAEALSRAATLAADLAWLQADRNEQARGRTAAEDRCLELERQIDRLHAAHGGLATRCEALATQAAEATAALSRMQAEATETRAGHEREQAEARRRLTAAESTRGRLEDAAADRDATIGRLQATIRQLESAVAEARSLAERHEREADLLAGERDDLAAQLEAERRIHESLRQDMTGRIQAAAAGRRRSLR